MLLSVILALLLGVTWLGILGSSAGNLEMAGSGSQKYWEEIVLENGDATNRVLVIQVDGLISSLALDPSGGTMVDSITDQLDLAAKDSTIRGVILKIDSPGGEVLASDDIYRALKDFQADTGKPIVASMSGLAASGGYYVAAPCRWIVANELTITGSIGVIMHSYNYRGLMDKVGITPQVFKSGRFKDMLSGDKAPDEILPETRVMVQAMIDETFDRFKAVVAEGRTWSAEQNSGDGKPLSENWEEYADGRILSGKQAFELGFVDELGNADQAKERIGTLLGLSDFGLIRYQEPFSFGSLFRIFGKAPSQSIKVDLGVDLPRLQAGRLYFLAPNYIH